LAAKTQQIDASKNVDLNPVLHDGFIKPWADVFTRLSDEGMAAVRERRAARDEREEQS